MIETDQIKHLSSNRTNNKQTLFISGTIKTKNPSHLFLFLVLKVYI